MKEWIIFDGEEHQFFADELVIYPTVGVMNIRDLNGIVRIEVDKEIELIFSAQVNVLTDDVLCKVIPKYPDNEDERENIRHWKGYKKEIEWDESWDERLENLLDV